MKMEEKLLRFAEAQRLVGDFLEKGWGLERMDTEDERDEPFKVYICVSIEGESAHEGVI